MGDERFRVMTLGDNITHVVATQAKVVVDGMDWPTIGNVGQLLCGLAYFPAGYSNMHTKGLPSTVITQKPTTSLHCASRM